MFRYEPKISCYFVIVKISCIEFHFSDDDELCPVKTFVRHKRKLNPNCVFLFQRPSCDVRYDNISLGPNQLGNIMSDISKEFSLSWIYTNQSTRYDRASAGCC